MLIFYSTNYLYGAQHWYNLSVLRLIRITSSLVNAEQISLLIDVSWVSKTVQSEVLLDKHLHIKPQN